MGRFTVSYWWLLSSFADCERMTAGEAWKKCEDEYLLSGLPAGFLSLSCGIVYAMVKRGLDEGLLEIAGVSGTATAYKLTPEGHAKAKKIAEVVAAKHSSLSRVVTPAFA